VVPDVAADAAGGTGYFVVAGGKAGVVGGTSAATPLWASLIARLNAARGAGKDVGYLTPVLYQSTPQTNGQPLGSVACNDITSGNNDTAADGGYSAGPGYDATTGWGSPNGAKLLQLIP
jgi:kumamolisin